jgi:hypothetical protein
VAQRAAKLFLFDKNFEKVFQFFINLFKKTNFSPREEEAARPFGPEKN